MYTKKKTEYQKGYKSGEELVAAHVNADGKAKAKEYIKKLADKNKGKVDAMNYFIDNSASYYVPPQIMNENNKDKRHKMKQNKVRLTESQLRNIVNETVSQILEYNDEWLKRVADCEFLSDEDKKAIQIGSINNWDRHEREAKKKEEMDNLERMANQNTYDKRMVGESLNKTTLRNCIKKVLSEGHWNSSVYDEFSELRDILGDDTLISELYNWMGGDSIEDFIQHTRQMYDLDDTEYEY